MRCPACGRTSGRCPECGKSFAHGLVSHCPAPACKKMNAPIDCGCGLVVADPPKGVININTGALRPWRGESSRDERARRDAFEAGKQARTGGYGLTKKRRTRPS